MNAIVTIDAQDRDAQIIRDIGTIADKIMQARQLFDEGDAIAAKLLASGGYDLSKALAQFARRAKSMGWVEKSRKMQGDALLIEMLSKMQIAREWDLAQGAGEAATRGRPKKKNVSNENVFTSAEAGLSRAEILEGRNLLKAEGREPGLVERAIAARIEAGLEPSRRAVKHAIGTRSANNDDKGDQLYETPPEATRALLTLESFSSPFKEPAVGRGAILTVMEAAGYDGVISDLRDREIATKDGELQQVGDFLVSVAGETLGMDIVTNPPYGDVANAFLAHALRVHKPRKMAALLNLNFMCGFDDPERRYVMDENPPSRVYVFTRRLPMMHRDGWDGPKSTSQMNTAWFVWERNEDGSYGAGLGQWQTIRVDWQRQAEAETLAPGEGCHAGPMLFADPEDDFTRTTPRKTLDERIEEEFTRAMAWLKDNFPAPFDAATFRKGVALRESVAAALLEAMLANGIVEPEEEAGMMRVSAQGIAAVVDVAAIEAVKEWRAGRVAA